MDEVILRRTLIAGGYGDGELMRLRTAGDLRQVRRGGYVRGQGLDLTAEERHREVVAATLPQLWQPAVVSHVSAAVLHGLPVWAAAVDRVHVTRPRAGGGKRRSLVEVHTCPLDSVEVVELGGIAVTSLARTVVDVARSVPLEQAVAATDKALALGLSVPDLQAALDRGRGRVGINAARRAAARADGRSESAGESVSRIRLVDAGLPAPELQLEIHRLDGTLIGRSDLAWKKQRTIGEFDGRQKYGRLLQPGQDVREVVYREKLREDALRDLGWQVVRWTWSDLERPDVVAERVLRAFRRSGWHP